LNVNLCKYNCWHHIKMIMCKLGDEDSEVEFINQLALRDVISLDLFVFTRLIEVSSLALFSTEVRIVSYHLLPRLVQYCLSSCVN
jgi:hypothetical protein